MLLDLLAASLSIVDDLSESIFLGEGAEILTSRVARGFVGDGEDMTARYGRSGRGRVAVSICWN